MPKLRTLAPKVRPVDTRTTRPPPRPMNPTYNTLEYQAWRKQVVARADYRCEAVDKHGHRCTNATPHHRLYADHIRELQDGGEPFNVANGQCLCAAHHARKTMAARARRLRD
jgi:5-methylcytosine-specific restriction protein A